MVLLVNWLVRILLNTSLLHRDSLLLYSSAILDLRVSNIHWLKENKGFLFKQPYCFVINKRFACMLSPFSHVQLFTTLWTLACQAPLSMIFSSQKYWSGLPCPPPEDQFVRIPSWKVNFSLCGNTIHELCYIQGLLKS